MEEPRLTVRIAALVGLVSGLAALGAGHLVAGLVGGSASPYFAVGNTAIDHTPSWLKDFAVRTFGTQDKLVLLLGMAVTIVGFMLLAGVVSRRRALPGLVLIGLLGVVGTLAVLQRPDVGRLGVLAGLTALAVGVLVFGWLHARAMAAVPSAATADDAPAASGDVGRRGVLVAGAATVVAAGVAGAVGQALSGRVDVQASRRAVGEIRPSRTQPPIPGGADFVADGTPSFITSNTDFYRIDTALVVPRLRAEDWQLRVHGMVDRELRIDYDALRRRELVEKTVTLTCVSNEVGGPYISTATFVGVPLRDVLRDAGVQAGADQLASRSSDGWTCGTPTEAAMEGSREAILALAMNGEPLPAEHGFPVRMVIPGLYGYVSATKWLVDLELTRFGAFDAYWARRGWAERAPIKTMSRIDRPTGFQKVPGGRVVVAGTAWAQTTGIDAVEVRADGGPWVEATLSTEVNLDTWRMWRAELDLAPGGHTVECRATDRHGRTQTQDRAEPVPDGATGWHSVFFTVT
jgi:DMSO/TMAO reductase YedYZ molybdopterin-dependent catalytic subunit